MFKLLGFEINETLDLENHKLMYDFCINVKVFFLDRFFNFGPLVNSKKSVLAIFIFENI